MKTYESDDNLNYDDLSGGDIGEVKGYGPTYTSHSQIIRGEIPQVRWDSIFSIDYKFEEGYYPENKRFFDLGNNEYSTVWRISGNLDELYREQDLIEEGKIRVVKINPLNSRYTKAENEEAEVKNQLRKDIRRFELAARNGERITKWVSGVFSWKHAYNNVCYHKEQHQISYK